MTGPQRKEYPTHHLAERERMARPPTGPEQAGYAAARAIMRHHAHTFYFAARWLPARRRRATHALYALFRTLDDLVDEVAAGERPREQARTELNSWRRWLHDPVRHPRSEPMLPAVLATMREFAVSPAWFLDLIDGLEMDLDGCRYTTFADLTLYCYRVASTVGLAMCRVLDARHPAAAAYAAELGVAMQLTNILRDVREDREAGRVYLPADLLARAGWDERTLAAGQPDDAFRALIAELVARARLYYRRGERGLPFLCPDGRFAIVVAARCYAGILDQIERAGYDVFVRRAHVSTAGKLGIALASAARAGINPRGPLPSLPAGAPDGPRLLHMAAAARAARTPLIAASAGESCCTPEPTAVMPRRSSPRDPYSRIVRDGSLSPHDPEPQPPRLRKSHTVQ